MIVYTDSGLREYCYIIGDFVKVRNPHSSPVTVNEGEYKALLLAIRHIWDNRITYSSVPIEIEFRSDSQLMIRQLNGQYKCKSPMLSGLKKQIWDTARSLIKVGYGVSFVWVPREQNLAGIELEKGEKLNGK
jgi:ribonuclease HI